MADFDIIQTTEETTVVVVEEVSAEIISEGAIGPAGPPGAAGEPGPQGPSGPNTIGGFEIQLTNPVAGDILGIGSNKVINISAPSLTDGGNF